MHGPLPLELYPILTALFLCNESQGALYGTGNTFVL